MVGDWIIAGCILVCVFIFFKKAKEGEQKGIDDSFLTISERTADQLKRPENWSDVQVPEETLKLSIDEIIARADRGISALANKLELHGYQEAKFHKECRSGNFCTVLYLALRDEQERYTEIDVMKKFIEAANEQAMTSERLLIDSGLTRTRKDWEDQGREIYFQIALILCAFRTSSSQSFANTLSFHLRKSIFHRFWEDGEELFQYERYSD
ncbi:hypothetical protein [Vibrio parahaemolyticus]|uniref:hypothetical protein n=1 Tax=Vibrio parahaemolyticus TaxID=670 RepID=UPI0021530FDD|nr:hypothetical protein [Vibrio parahaemolyticus]